MARWLFSRAAKRSQPVICHRDRVRFHQCSSSRPARAADRHSEAGCMHSAGRKGLPAFPEIGAGASGWLAMHSTCRGRGRRTQSFFWPSRTYTSADASGAFHISSQKYQPAVLRDKRLAALSGLIGGSVRPELLESSARVEVTGTAGIFCTAGGGGCR